METNLNRPPNINSLIGIKVIAMLLIFWWHSTIPNPEVDLGARACEIFFVISGFLIGYNNFNRIVPATWKESVRFSATKIIRFYPLHLITFIIVFIKFTSTLDVSNVFSALLNLTLLQAWSNNADVFFSYNGVSWFLSALVFCYFMSPILLKLSKDVKVSGVLFIIVFLLRFYVSYVIKVNPELITLNVHVSPVIRCMEFFMGMLLTPIFIHFNSLLVNKKSFLIFTLLEIISIVLVVYLVIIHKEWDRSIFVLIFSLFIFVFSFDKGALSILLGSKPFKWLSVVQFEFYILHQAIIRCLIENYWEIFSDWRLLNLVMFLTIILIAVIYKKYLSTRLTKVMREMFNLVCKVLKINLII